MKDQPLAVVLLSGGMDSCVAAALTRSTHRLAFLHASYGQRTESRELKAFHDIADFYHVQHRLAITLGHLSAIGGSSLTDSSMPVPDADFGSRGIPTSYVPFRNANFLSAAVSWGEVLGASAICVGAVEEDSSGYPDCRAEFFDAFNHVIRTGTKSSGPQVVTPVVGMSKAEIVLRGRALGAPLQVTWSCYRRDDVACGTCDSCARRLRGFQLAGFDDPIPYVHKPVFAAQ